jgi:ubiquinone biosynthesis protein UbiJ
MRILALSPESLINPAEVAAALEGAKAARDEVNRLIKRLTTQRRLKDVTNHPAILEVIQ